LDEELKRKQQKVEQLKKDLTDWEKDIQKDNERVKRLKEREIEQTEIFHENAKQRKNTREKAFDEQINTIELALQRIEEISKTSPTIQN
jgi:hypothetical protein